MDFLWIIGGLLFVVSLFLVKRPPKKKFDKFQNVRVEEAHKYIDSKKWNKKRKERLKIDHFTCQKCGAKNTPIQVHHKTYKNHKNEIS